MRFWAYAIDSIGVSNQKEKFIIDHDVPWKIWNCLIKVSDSERFVMHLNEAKILHFSTKRTDVFNNVMCYPVE